MSPHNAIPGQDENASTPSDARRRHHKRRSPRSSPGPVRPGRFFRICHRIDRVRRAMLPVHLGEADWLLYRRSFNPYRADSHKHAAYARGFEACKKALPKPARAPL